MTGVAEKVTEVPAHTGFADDVIVKLTDRIGFTVMVTVLDVAGFPDVHAALEVNEQVIALPFTGINE